MPARDRLGDLLRQVAAAPYRYDFFALLRAIECACPERLRLGQATRPADEPIRLGQEASLVFAPSTLAYLEPAREGRPPRIGVHFFGMLGPNGPLPIHMTEYARDRVRNAGDQTLVRFLDIFHHRALALFYRGWANAQPTVHRDRPSSDRFATYVGSLFGVGSPAVRDRDLFPDSAKLYFAGRFAHQARNAEGLRAIVADYFRLPTDLEEFVGEWTPLQEEERWRITRTAFAGALGISTILGAHAWQRQTKVRIVFGPLKEHEFQSLLPGSERLQRLTALVRNYVGDALNWDVRLFLDKRVSHPFRLDRITRLGWTSWLGHCPEGEGRDDLIINPHIETSTEEPTAPS
ncbi:MAG: type VI secretion system baseplate subunit TssG [Deltaproteobacteria bacterium]|nr:type VI secretion system baseplate subunit TssG [Deltaproteobacteria bacterium]